MRLSSISSVTLREAFSRTDFFDMYTLLYASKDERYKTDRNVQRLTQFYVDYILNDLITQLANLCTIRFQEKGKAFGIPDREPRPDFADRDRKIKAIPLSTKLRFLDHIVTNKISSGFTAGNTWRGLCAEVLRATKATSHQQRVIAVDRLMNLLHHGGSITDYLDGSRWLPEALNYRDNASFLHLARHASGEVKKAIGMSAFIGTDRADVPILKMLETAILRGNSSRQVAIETSVVDNKIFIRLNDKMYNDKLVALRGSDWELNRPIDVLVGTHINDRIFFSNQDGSSVELVFGDDSLFASSVKLPITDYNSLVRDIQEWLLNFRLKS